MSARTGEAAGFEWLFDSFGRRVHGFLVSQGSSDADDVTSEVFASAFRSLGSFEGGEAQFVSWLFRIARNRLIDRGRAAGRRPRTDGGEAPDRAGRVDVESEALSRLGNSELASVLGQLSDDQREVLVLRFVSDLSIDQVAEVMDRKPNAVKALQYRAIRAVHRILSLEAVTR